MGTCTTRECRRAATSVLLAAALVGAPGAAASGESSGGQEAETTRNSDKAVVEPYKTRPAPSHRVSLHDDRVFFLKKLEETGSGFVLHTMEDETIEVDQSEIAEIVELQKE